MSDDKKATRADEIQLEHMDSQHDNSIQAHGSPEALASLFSKIAKVQKKVKVLKHTGKFNAGSTKYSYATERDVVEPISNAFAAENVALIPSVVDSWWHDIPTKYNTNRVTTVQVQTLIGDGDTGAYVVAGARSTAANADKATNAAFTTAVKYQLAKLAVVAFGDDADEYTLDGDKAGTSPKALTKAQREVLANEISASGKGDEVKDLMKSERITFSKVNSEQAERIRKVLS